MSGLATNAALPAAEPNRALITTALMLATVMQVLDTTIANVALPSMTGALGASSDTITWVLTSYIVAAAIATPLTGWMSDRYGRKEVFLAATAGFVVASMACGMAWNLSSMVAFRLVQGVFGAAIVPLSQTFLLDTYPREKHGQAMAMWGAGIMVGPIIGPTLGGWLTESYNWRWVFYINLPVGLLAFLGCSVSLPAVARRVRRFDFFGFGMLALAVGALQLMLDRGGEVDWFSAPEIWIEAGIAASGLWVFAIHILTAKEPFIDPQIFRDQNFVAGLIFIFVVGVILLATLALLPPMLTAVFGYPTLTTGIVMAPRGVGTMISMLLVGRLVQKVDARLLVAAGLLLTALSLYLMTGFSPQMDAHPIIISGVVQGLGLGLVFVPLSTVAFATLEARFRTDATALFSLMRNIGSSIGISVVTALLTRNLQVNHLELGASLSATSATLNAVLPEAAAGDPATLSLLDGMLNQQAAMVAYVDDFKFMLIVTLLSLGLVFLLRAPKRAGDAPAAMPD